MAPTCLLLPKGLRVWVIFPAASAYSQSSMEREEAGERNSWFLGVGAKELAPWPDCYRGLG